MHGHHQEKIAVVGAAEHAAHIGERPVHLAVARFVHRRAFRSHDTHHPVAIGVDGDDLIYGFFVFAIKQHFHDV